VAYTGQLEVGKHEVRLNAKDRDGRAGGYRWQFDVQPRGAPGPTSAPTTRVAPPPAATPGAPPPPAVQTPALPPPQRAPGAGQPPAQPPPASRP